MRPTHNVSSGRASTQLTGRAVHYLSAHYSCSSCFVSCPNCYLRNKRVDDKSKTNGNELNPKYMED